MGHVQYGRITKMAPGRDPVSGDRVLSGKGEGRELVLVVYWAHNRAVASEYSAKLYLVADSIRMHRSDGSLIRVTTRLAPGENIDSAQQRLLSLSANLVPLINPYVPR